MIELTRGMLTVIDAASRDEARVALTGLRVEPGRVVATNGRLLVVLSHEKAETEAFTLSAAQTRTALRELGRGKKAIAQVAIKDGAVAVALTTGMTISAPANPGDYPAYDQIFPKGKPTLTIGLNADYLALLARIARANGGGPCVSLEIRDDVTAIVVRATGAENFTALLMPCRL